jgi:hypothetical protein
VCFFFSLPFASIPILQRWSNRSVSLYFYHWPDQTRPPTLFCLKSNKTKNLTKTRIDESIFFSREEERESKSFSKQEHGKTRQIDEEGKTKKKKKKRENTSCLLSLPYLRNGWFHSNVTHKADKLILATSPINCSFH